MIGVYNGGVILVAISTLQFFDSLRVRLETGEIFCKLHTFNLRSVTSPVATGAKGTWSDMSNEIDTFGNIVFTISTVFQLVLFRICLGYRPNSPGRWRAARLYRAAEIKGTITTEGRILTDDPLSATALSVLGNVCVGRMLWHSSWAVIPQIWAIAALIQPFLVPHITTILNTYSVSLVSFIKTNAADVEFRVPKLGSSLGSGGQNVTSHTIENVRKTATLDDDFRKAAIARYPFSAILSVLYMTATDLLVALDISLCGYGSQDCH
ncbi:hypothetical protein RRG08_003655 [Elysia crispata]|uniref:Uncharacterized protein n=1 Tax=Elysia crispata TaxID=231223 RepID=A0AAE1E4X2_9GAST|nr:hypothetical protein RRG08_003655 [Elysia crispata]